MCDFDDTNIQEALDLIGTTHNLCEIFNILASQRAYHLLYTVTEFMYETSQSLVDFCVED